MISREPTNSQFVKDDLTIERVWLDWLRQTRGAIVVQTTWIARTSAPASSFPEGSFLHITDKHVFFIQRSGAWKYIAGVWRDAVANIPTADLGANDVNLQFVGTDTGRHFYWTGTRFLEEQQVDDAATVTIAEVLRMIHTTSGTAGVGFGARSLTRLQNGAGNQVDGSSIDTAWTNATAGAENSSWTVRLRRVGAALADWFQVLTTGIQFKVGGFFGKFIHANTADRAYTLADADGNLVYETVALTDHAIVLGNGGPKCKPGTLGTSITVLHGNAGGDPTYGAVDLAADVTGVLPIANGGAYLKSLFDHFVDAGNGTTVETDLYSDNIAAGQLAADGDKLEVEYGGVFVSSATATRQVRVYFGGSLIFDTGALTLSLSSAWTAYLAIIRVDASTVRYMISLTTEGAALAAYTAVGSQGGLTLSNANVLKITGQAAGVGAATDDVVAKMGSVSYVKAA